MTGPVLRREVPMRRPKSNGGPVAGVAYIAVAVGLCALGFVGANLTLGLIFDGFIP